MSKAVIAENTAKRRPFEERILERIRRRERIARNVNVISEERLSVGDKLADRLAALAGSWDFIIGFFTVLLLWMFVNSYTLLAKPVDPYPFILLNLVLSCLAAIQAPVILMSQNRLAARDRLQADHDYEVNLKAETEIEGLHQKLDVLRERQWAELVEMQRRQIDYLGKLLGTNSGQSIPGESQT
ncbi:MAG: DUF1003 domain-containing protein [Chloroflexota bacterium]